MVTVKSLAVFLVLSKKLELKILGLLLSVYIMKTLTEQNSSFPISVMFYIKTVN